MMIGDHDKKVVTKKEHQCAGCYRTFPAGTSLLKLNFLNQADNTGWLTWHVCPVCEEYADQNKCTDYDGMYYEGFAKEHDEQLWEELRQKMEAKRGDE